VRIKALHKPDEVGERSRQPIQLVGHHAINPPSLDIRQQTAQCRALKRPAGEPAIIVAVAEQEQALGALGRDVCLAGISLGVEAIVFHI
jgi:hypothetical protein